MVLQGENYACALSNVYTFGPTFRAEHSYTARHLAEFWMIEPEMAFCTLQDDMQCAEDYVRYCCSHLLTHCREDMEFINKMIDKGAIARLEQVVEKPFQRISYTQAIELLQQHVAQGKKFEYPVRTQPAQRRPTPHCDHGFQPLLSRLKSTASFTDLPTHCSPFLGW